MSELLQEVAPGEVLDPEVEEVRFQVNTSCDYFGKRSSWGTDDAQLRQLLSICLSMNLNNVRLSNFLLSCMVQFLQEHVDEFVESVTEYACRLAKHRKSKILEARDIQLHLEKSWNIRVPGYGDDPRPAKRTAPTAIHNARMQAIAKSQQNQGSTH